jgi:AraC-like DNA-binding protein
VVGQGRCAAPDPIEDLPDPITGLATSRAISDVRRMRELLERLCGRVTRATDGMQPETVVPRLGLGVARQPSAPVMAVYEPIVCLVLQGAKEVLIGDQALRYDASSCFVASVDLPVTGTIVEASQSRPYVVTSLALDRDTLASLLVDLAPDPIGAPSAGFAVERVTPELLEAWDRLLELLDTPGDVPFLAAAREREVLYRLLQGAHGPMLRQVAREDSRLSQVRRAMEWIRRNYDRKLLTAELAAVAGMSVPSFHRHFRAATAMSPLQYQKSLRLQAARRMLATSKEAARAGYAVGYESASQFSREYTRAFGTPPTRDAGRVSVVQVGANPL